MTYKVFIDLYSLFSASRFRGIGAYTRNFLKKLRPYEFDFEIVFGYPVFGDSNYDMPEVSDFLSSLSYSFTVCKYELLSSDQTLAQKKVNNYIKSICVETIAPDIIYIPSHFDDHPLYSSNFLYFRNSIIKSSTFYDFIPLAERSKYINSQEGSVDYLAKVSNLNQSDILFSISDSSTQEYLSFLPNNHSKIITASTASNLDRNSDLPSISVLSQDIQSRLKDIKTFILYVGGIDERKNLPTLIEAYSMLPNEIKMQYPLIFAGQCPKDAQNIFYNHAESYNSRPFLHILDHVTDLELIYLYKKASLFVFPSRKEGFGIPPLEAMQFRCPVVCSNIPPMHEVVNNPDCYFDEQSASSISEKILEVINSESLRNSIVNKNYEQSKKFSWEKVATIISQSWKSSVEDKWNPRQHNVPQSYATNFCNFLRFIDKETEQYIRDNFNDVVSIIQSNTNYISSIYPTDLFNDFKLLAETSSSLLSWQIEGPFDSTYSLAILNANLASSLSKIEGVEVLLRSFEGYGEFKPSTEYLDNNPLLNSLHKNYLSSRNSSPDIVSRYCYPPIVDGMNGKTNIFHCFGWEESVFPQKYVDGFNQKLDYVTTMSSFSRKVLIDSGVKLPIINVGIGTDHHKDLSVQPTRYPNVFRFLHISSCFPRKGIDLLIEAFLSEFEGQGAFVELHIKTFENPHNSDLNDLVNENLIKYPNNPPRIFIISEEYSDQQIKDLYNSCDAYISLARGEGFCLPLAEAIINGLPVISTAHSGPLDFIDGNSSFLVDFSYEYSSSHVSSSSSFWVEPSLMDARRQMRKVYNLSEIDVNFANKKALSFLNNYTWDKVANLNANLYFQYKHRIGPFANLDNAHNNFGMITTWDQKCGIATYAKNQVNCFPANIHIFSNSQNSEENIHNVFMPGGSTEQLVDSIFLNNINIVYIQWNDSFFWSNESYSEFNDLITKLKSRNIIVVMIMHAVRSHALSPNRNLSCIRNTLSLIDRLCCHNIEDLNYLKSIGLHDNITLLPHGEFVPTVRPLSRIQRERLVFGTFGFLLPQKNIVNILKAFVQFKSDYNIDCYLKCYNSLHPGFDSSSIINEFNSIVKNNNLSSHCILDTDFIDDQDLISELNDIDLMIYAYSNHNESASGAVKHAFRAGCTVATTKYPMMNDTRGKSLCIKSEHPNDILSMMSNYLQLKTSSPEELIKLSEKATEVAGFTCWQKVTQKLHDMAISLKINQQ